MSPPDSPRGQEHAASTTEAEAECDEEGELIERLPDDMLLRVLDRRWERRESGAIRLVSHRWRAVHDGRACKHLWLDDGVTDEAMHALCGRLKCLTHLNLWKVSTLSGDGLAAMGALASLTELRLYRCSNVTDAVLRELRGLTALTDLYLVGGLSSTDARLQHLRVSLAALTDLSVTQQGSTTHAGRDALKAALPGLTIYAHGQ